MLSVLPDFGLSVVGSYFDEAFAKRALHDMGQKLTEWLRTDVPGTVHARPHVVHGRVYDEIIAAADRLQVDVIVMAAHRPELSDYLLGPNAARVMRHAKQSVFVVRGP